MVFYSGRRNARAGGSMIIERDDRLDWAKLAWAALAVGAGCALLVALGAPPRMPMMNGAALLIGLAGVAAIWASRRAGVSATAGDIALLAASALIPLTALVGPQADGVARWLVIGGLTLQPALIVVPLVAVGQALRPSWVRCLSAIVTLAGLALQPDPGWAMILLLAIVVVMGEPGNRNVGTWVVVAVAAICVRVAIVRNVALPPVPFVEGVLPDAFGAGALPTLIAFAAIALIIAPAVTRRLTSPHLAFLAVWIGALTAALLGPYPTPVIGFGGSGVLGFVLSAGLVALGTRALRRGQSGLV
jgi:hypothetical protein